MHTIKVGQDNYKAPKGAQFYLPARSGAPSMYYRYCATKMNDGTIGVGFCYFSFAKMWCGSNLDGAHELTSLVPCHNGGYNVTYHRKVEGWQGSPQFEDYAATKEDLDVIVELLSLDELVTFGFHQQEGSPLAVKFKG